MRRTVGVGGLVLGLVLLLTTPAAAFIMKLIPLKDVLKESQHVLLLRVDRLDPARPAVVFTVDEELKGKSPTPRLPVNLEGDSEAKQHKHTEQLLKRLAPKMTVVLFVTQRGKRYTGFAFTNGTWFQMVGLQGDGDDAVRWSFTHCEPYLRRTFAGTTPQLIEAARDGLSGKNDPPEPNAKEPPGLGPEADAPKDGARLLPRHTETPRYAVIPTVLIGGPLAILAALFPAVFGGLLLSLRRWLAVLTVASLNSTLFLVHGWFESSLRPYWWGSATTLWVTMTVLTVLGLLWAWRRHQQAEKAGQDPHPQRIEQIVLWSLTVLGLVAVGYSLATHQSLLTLGQKTMLVIWIGAWVGTVYAVLLLWRLHRHPQTRPMTSTEGIMLGAMLCAFVGLGFAHAPVTTGGVRVAWVFRPDGRGRVASSPLLTPDRVYAATALQSGFDTYGSVHCVDRVTGEPVWSFDNDGDLKQVFSSPCLADGRLYIGEGFHEDRQCRLFCLDAATGKKLWEFATRSHTESSPCVADGKVFVGAGDDGVYCLDAVTGKPVWNFPRFHVDSSPCVHDGRVFAGSGVGDEYRTTAVFALDASTGTPVWQQPTALPAWGSPTVADGQVFFGVGNGNFLTSDSKPAGTLVGLDAATGKPLWPAVDAPDGVLTRPVVVGDAVVFGCRDGNLTCVGRADGQVRWKQAMGSAVVASPAALALPDGTSWLFVAASAGKVACVDAATGTSLWQFDVAGHAEAQALLLSSPAVELVEDAQGRRCLVTFGAELTNVSSGPALYCLEAAIEGP